VAAVQTSRDHLTAYERAVCYYTIPRVTSPLTGGLVIAYAIVLAEAVALLVYGVAAERENFVWWGAASTISAIVFGIVVFFGRSLQNAIHERKALAQAALVPDSDSETSDLPDPFAGHLLFRYRRQPGIATFDIEDNSGAVRYHVKSASRDKRFEIVAADGRHVADVRALSSRRSFLFDFTGNPGKVVVRRGDTELAHALRRYTLMDPSCDIFISEPAELHLVTRRGAIYRNDRLVGRIYTARQFTYLDIESKSFSEGMLGYYVAMA
jgi:hypothetical protein